MRFLSMRTIQQLPHFFFFNDTATTEIYTLSLHDALPIFSSNVKRNSRTEEAVSMAVCASSNASQSAQRSKARCRKRKGVSAGNQATDWQVDRKSTRLNSSHGYISYAVFCLKKKNKSQLLVRSKRRPGRASGGAARSAASSSSGLPQLSPPSSAVPGAFWNITPSSSAVPPLS